MKVSLTPIAGVSINAKEVHMTPIKRLTPVDHDFRKTGERRIDDLGPPAGWKERRRSVERRMPEVKEDEFTQSEWFGQMAAFVDERATQEEEIRKAFEALERKGP